MAKTKEIGGGPAVGLANDTVSSLQSLLNGGGIGTAGSPNPMGSTGNIMKVLRDILSAGGGDAGNAISQLINKSQDRAVQGLRARFGASGGAAFGTPAAFAESQYRAEAAPQTAQAISGLQMNAIQPLLNMILQLSGKGITQRQIVQQKSPLEQGLGLVAGIGKAALPFFAPGIGHAAAAGLGAASSAGSTFGVDSGGGDVGSADLASLRGYFGGNG